MHRATRDALLPRRWRTSSSDAHQHPVLPTRQYARRDGEPQRARAPRWADLPGRIDIAEWHRRTAPLVRFDGIDSHEDAIDRAVGDAIDREVNIDFCGTLPELNALTTVLLTRLASLGPSQRAVGVVLRLLRPTPVATTLVQHPDGTCMVARPTGGGVVVGGDVVVPIGVVAIGTQTFQEYTTIRSVELPVGLRVIEKWAFARCANLQRVALPESLERIEASAFLSCAALRDLGSATLALRTIESCAFDGCAALPSFAFPASLEEVGFAAFRSCARLVVVDMSSCTCRSISGDCFAQCSSLATILLNDTSLRTIEVGAFRDCTSLSRIRLPARLVCSNAFDGCTSLTQVVFLNDVHIDDRAFSRCRALTSVEFEKGSVVHRDVFPETTVVRHSRV